MTLQKCVKSELIILKDPFYFVEFVKYRYQSEYHDNEL